MEENTQNQDQTQETPAPEPVCPVDGNLAFDQDGVCLVCGNPKASNPA